VGINVHAVSYPGRAALGPAVSRLEVLGELVPAVRATAAARGHLSDREVADFALRDIAQGRRCSVPVSGRVMGIAPDGALLIETSSGVSRIVEGSLVLEHRRQE
jgi:hypothetical protein